MACAACGHQAPEGSRFCPSCGHELAVRGEERRVATVLFADIVGFTSLSEGVDPEQVKRLVDRCFERLAADVDSYGGVIDKIVGDGLLALFGAPVAHEDDAERAVRAALKMLHTIDAERGEIRGNLQLRIGVNTGEVVTGALRAGGDYTAMGDVVNTAQRLQVAAQPGQVVVGAATHAATEDVIAYRSLGPLEAKGKGEAVEAWLAESALLPPGYRERRYTPLVGRDEELGMLHHAVNTAVAQRRGHLIVLLGEAGVGKTRLAEELAEVAVATHDAVVLEGRCVPYGEANVWWPVAEALRQAIGIGNETGLDLARAATVEAVAAALAPEAGRAEVERLAEGILYLLGYEGPLKDIDPLRAREEANRSVLVFIEASARARPVVVVLSDLHWADPVVLSMIDDLMDRLGRDRFVLVATARQELNNRWGARAGRHNQLVVNLDPLDREATAILLDHLFDGELPRDARDLLLDRSGGNPFFLEELVNLVGDAGAASIAAGLGADHQDVSDLPETLRGLVAARLDALTGGERRLLEDASVWGRSGKIDVLERMGAFDDRGDIAADLAGLVDKEVLTLDEGHWSFRSDLVRDVAYGTLTKADRARAHHGIAWYLERHGTTPDDADDRLVDVIANHYATAAQLVRDVGDVQGVADDAVERALVWIGEAAERAHGAQVLPVSIRLIGQALDLVGDEVTDRRVDLLLSRASSLSESYRLPEATDDCELADRLASDLDYRRGQARARFVEGQIAQHSGDFDRAIGRLSDAVALFEDAGDRKGEADALRAIGMAQLFTADHPGAEVSFRGALEISRELADRRGEAWALQQMAWISFVQGDTTEADGRLDRAGDTFEALGDTGGLAWVNGMRAFVRFQQGDFETAEQLGEAVLVEARERGDRWAESMMMMLVANVRLWSGRASEALVRAEEALAIFREIGDRFGEMQALAVQGRTLVMLGRITDGFRSLEASGSIVLGMHDDNVASLGQAATAGAAVQVGDPRLAPGAMGTIGAGDLDPTFIGDADRIVALGLLRLQTGQVDEAVEILELVGEASDVLLDSPYALSSLALAYAAQGRVDEVLELRQKVNEMPRATYLDQGTAALAAALVRARLGEPDAANRFEAVVRAADATDDRVAQAVTRLTQAYGLEALGDERAADVRAEADGQLADLGLAANGWRRAIELILAGGTSGDGASRAAVVG